ncbi:MAG: DNA/RNA non-specific endonuclease [Bacteroidaceae bacterium]|nr:DNA/RNA non-specific endonuclease [Bacteroidaceae bacterium]
MAGKDKKGRGISYTIWALAGALGLGSVAHNCVSRQELSSIKEAVESFKEVAQPITCPETTEPLTEITPYGNHEPGWEIPVASNKDKEVRLHRTGYTLSYNTSYKVPNWVGWKLTGERVRGKAKRTNIFLPDPDIQERYQAFDTDYRSSGYDRGHMAPAGDMKWNEKAMNESFYLSNICPQASHLNQGGWRIVEEQCREWVKSEGDMYIVCGPIFEEGARHKRIGRNKVYVPEKFFKVILMEGNQLSAVGFIFPNDDCRQKVEFYAATIDRIEEVTGLDFFSALPDEVENRIEATAAFKELF